ncbi:hypothetical protein GLOIN_2v1765586 [Rhizophagus clarus]|uniref:Uncharacterized protein n=1 Tax=Rhizophagus clarus TaxID=94130 RepID=A0A8H3QZP9_9GLOM|nr:hypothetical protein GLOIN_2v1765586 [Rhizophagus clarus]
MLRQRMRCDAPPFSPADYDHIMQCAEKKPRDKVLKDLTDKYHISQQHIYQIWRGEEKNRTEPETQGHDVSPFTELEKEIRDAKIEPSKSTDPVSEESAGRKAKKTGEKKRSQGGQSIPGTKKENISSTKSSEDVLNLYKRSSSEIEKIRASGRTLIPN